ncbi:MAG: FAD-dependent oxidoreductase [Gammaproteobacteria bacterium]
MLVDTGRLNRIVDLNEIDMYVSVEPGITWAELWNTLKAKGLRTSFWGPFSGIKATVGGSMSQNSASLGSGNHGVSADAVLAFDIVLANGEIMQTGSSAARNGLLISAGMGRTLPAFVPVMPAPSASSHA